MRRVIFGLAAAMLCLAASEASACHHKVKTACVPACAPAPVCAPAPTCAPAKKHCFKMPKLHMPKLCCKKKVECAPAPCETVVYAAPQGTWAAPQAAATGQMPAVPSK